MSAAAAAAAADTSATEAEAAPRSRGGSGGVGCFVGGGADSIFIEGDSLDSETAREGLLLL